MKTTYLTRSEAAEIARCSVATLDRAIRLGELVTFKPGRVLIRPADLRAWIEAKQVKPLVRHSR